MDLGDFSAEWKPETVTRNEGVTPEEQYLQRLCDSSFLSLWSYAGPSRDQRSNGKSDGKELCDLLVVSGDKGRDRRAIKGVTDGTSTQPVWKFARPHVLTGNAWVIVPSVTPFPTPFPRPTGLPSYGLLPFYPFPVLSIGVSGFRGQTDLTLWENRVMLSCKWGEFAFVKVTGSVCPRSLPKEAVNDRFQISLGRCAKLKTKEGP